MTYDNYGNIISKNGKQYCYDEIWHDLLTCYNGQAIEYDAQGNPVKYLGHTLTWEKADNSNHLTAILIPIMQTASEQA